VGLLLHDIVQHQFKLVMKIDLPTQKSLLYLSVILLLTACSSGKKRFEKGDYDRATYQAIKRLQNNPDNKKATKYLPLAYNYAIEYHLEQITRLKSSAAEFKYDGVVGHYRNLNGLYNAIVKCPACIRIVKSPTIFQTELDQSNLLASKAHFNAGVRELEKNNKVAGRAAYRHFLDAKNFTPQYNKIESYLDKALDMGTIMVLLEDIPVHSRALALSNEFFQNQILEYVRGLNYTFVDFIRADELEAQNLEPDEVIIMRFDDFVVGQTYVKERVENVERDSVKIGMMDTENGEKPIYGTAKAKLTTIEKTLTSSGLLDFQIVNAASGATLIQKKFPGTFIWSTKWATFNGMEEALTKEELKLSSLRESYPPPPQDLFVAFTRPIYKQIIVKIRSHYQPLRR
jgi:hypothetical protein